MAEKLLKDFIKESVKALLPQYEEAEAHSMVMMLCQECLGVMSWTHVTEPGTLIPDEDLPYLQEAVSRMAGGEPIQYVLGYTEFRGRIFKTDRRALIPRIETELLVEEVVHWVSEQQGPASEGVRSAHPTPGRPAVPPLPGRGRHVLQPQAPAAPIRVLDLCTGSGCIAWSLAFELPGSQVTAADLSEDALALAKSQFRRLPKGVLRPSFIHGDILDFNSDFPQCDIFTANPPYITLPERSLMRANVLDWEPEMALFAPESDPLAFHKALALWAERLLVPGGFGIVEINEDLGPESLGIFASMPAFTRTRLVEDFAGKPRFVSFVRAE